MCRLRPREPVLRGARKDAVARVHLEREGGIGRDFEPRLGSQLAYIGCVCRTWLEDNLLGVIPGGSSVPILTR